LFELLDIKRAGAYAVHAIPVAKKAIVSPFTCIDFCQAMTTKDYAQQECLSKAKHQPLSQIHYYKLTITN
jgi:hypothetical protein